MNNKHINTYIDMLINDTKTTQQKIRSQIIKCENREIQKSN